MMLALWGCGGDNKAGDSAGTTTTATTVTTSTTTSTTVSTTSTTTAPTDLDSDGFDALADGGTDCDDTNAAIHPDAVEICNQGVDDDCDGDIDEDDASLDTSTAIVGWPDVDLDGLGDPATPLYDCAQMPVDSVDNDDDCDDTDATVLLGPEWRFDGDGDSFGGGPAVPACVLPGADWLPADGRFDCDDGLSSVYPDAPEVCGDGIDQSCDSFDTTCSQAISGGLNYTDARLRLVGENNLDVLGVSVDLGQDLTGNGDLDLVTGAQWSDVGATQGGTVFVVEGPLPVGTTTAAVASATVYGTVAYAEFGASLSMVGDVNGDLLPDLLIGAPGIDIGTGAAYLFHGPLTGDTAMTSADAVLNGSLTGDEAGRTVAAAGDVNGDTFADLLIGAPNAPDGGVIYLVSGPVSGVQGLATAGTVFEGEFPQDGLQAMAGGADVNGDGLMDVLLGATGVDALAAEAGAAYLFLGPAVGPITAWDARVDGLLADAQLGTSVALADLDADGYADLLLGSEGDDTGGLEAGAVHVFRGPLLGGFDSSQADASYFGGVGQRAGGSVAAGDLDGNGPLEVIIGAPGDEGGGIGAGATFVVYGPTWGVVDLANADATLRGQTFDFSGTQTVSGSDLDGDGFDELAIGAWSSAMNGGGAGALFVFFGGL